MASVTARESPAVPKSKPNQNNTMKSILTLAIAAIALITAVPSAEAGYGNSCQSYCRPSYCCTKVVCRHTECRWATDHCGRNYRYHVTVVTYADLYSDGSRNTYTRTYRA